MCGGWGRVLHATVTSFGLQLDEAASALPCIVAAPQSPTPPGQGADGDSGLVRQPSQAEAITLTPRQQRGHLLASVHAATMSAFDGETRCASRDGYAESNPVEVVRGDPRWVQRAK